MLLIFKQISFYYIELTLRHEEAYALLHPAYRLWDVIEL